MLPQFIRRAGVLLAMTGVGVLGAASAAGADAGRADASTQTMAASQVSRPAAVPDAAALAWDITFDRYVTAGLWNASGVSVAAFAAYCAAAVPSFARPACLFIANSSLFGQFPQAGPTQRTLLE